MNDKLAVTLLTGPRACSKSLIARLLCELGTPGKFVWIDTSRIITRNMELKTVVGNELLEFLSHMQGGKVLPGKPVYRACSEWINALCSQSETYHIILAGSTRSPEESIGWKQYSRPVRVMHIDANNEQIMAGIKHRQEVTGIVRSDENEKALADAIAEHKEKILPSVEMFGKLAGHTSRSKTVRQRLFDTINHIFVPETVRSQMLARLGTKNHPVSIEVDKLDGVVCTKKQTAKITTATIMPCVIPNVSSAPTIVEIAQ